MQSESHNRWAVLVGIDQYEPPVRSLSGCVQDVIDVSNFLKSHLRVPAEHIDVLSAPLGTAINYSAPDVPTKKNVVQALKKMEKKKSGAFIYFHYSGHGGREATQYASLKGADQKDETVCTWEEEITDVELGNILDELAQKHTVLVVLDSCHSGGGDREGTEPAHKIRCKDFPIPISTSRGTGKDRNVIPSYKSQLYRERKYNLLAACHPSERASEWSYLMPENGGQKEYPCGAMTFFFLKSLEKFSNSKNPVSYGQLQNVLQAEFKANAASLGQQPLHLGNNDRVLFAATTLNAESRGLANVIHKNHNSVTLDRGSSRQVAVGDRFLLYPPSKVYLGLVTADDTAGTEVEITRTSDFESTAIITPETPASLEFIETGWFARLKWRVSRKTVHVQLPPGDNDLDPALKRLRQDWSTHVDPYAPLELVFTSPVRDADFTVQVDENGNFQLQKNGSNTFEVIPLISAYGDRNLPQLMGLLSHLSSYQLLVDMTQASGRQNSNYKLSIQETPADTENPKSLGGWNISFENISERTLYVTILALGPAFGIQEVFPNRFANSSEIEPGETLPSNVCIDIEVPNLLASRKEEPRFRMSDRLKVFVTESPVNFREYEQPDLEEDPAKLERRAQRAKVRVPRVSAWVVEDLEIITKRKDGRYVTYDAAKPPKRR